jgi:hypothetical protein
MAKQNIYQDNILNQYDNYTYNWAIHMVNPINAHRFEKNISQGNVKTIAHSGVESEINIESIEHILSTAFKKNQDRSSFANMFGVTMTEPGGATLFTRIVKAALDLDIENHLQACYLLELKFLAYDQNGQPVVCDVGPYYYMCTLVNLTFNYNDGSTTYTGDFLETHQDAYKTQTLHVKQEIPNLTASTFGEFLTALEKEVNVQEQRSTFASPSKDIFDDYKLGCLETEWLDLPFGATGAGGDTSLSSVSVKGNGTLTFNIKPGTSVSDAMVVALLQTDHFRKLPTAGGGFHKDHPDDAEAKPKTFGELSQWFIFDNEILYGLYDNTAKRYSKQVTYNLHKFIVPELNHDALSYQAMISDLGVQKERLKKIVENGLLRKRFDFTYTGLNTEVLGLDVTLNNTYYSMQAINSGRLSNRAKAVAGASGSTDELNQTQTEYETIKKQIDANKAKITNLKKRAAKIRSDRDAGIDSEINIGAEAEIAAREAEQSAQALEQENIRLEKELSKAFDESKKVIDRLKEQASLRSIQPVNKRYITQSELTGQAVKKDRDQELPVSYLPMPISSKANAGPDTGDTAGAVLLGAVELNLNSLGDLIQQQIQIRGDPYWLGKPKGAHNVLNEVNDVTGRAGANYTQGGCMYFLNMNFPTYPDQFTGLMNIPEANFGIIGLYRVYRVVANYRDGRFDMTIESYRDMNSNTGLIWEEISTGRIDANRVRQEEEFKQQQPDDIDDAFDPPIDQPGDDLGTVTDGTGNGTVTEDQSTVAGVRKQGIANDLKQILTKAGQESGLNVRVTSGGQPAKGTSTDRVGSTRHDDGHAADIELSGADGRVLSLDNPADVPLIQNFIIEAKNAGATGIGAGNGYMGNNRIHVDNAAQYGQAPGGTSYWGGLPDNQGNIRAKNAPQWLKTIMTG